MTNQQKVSKAERLVKTGKYNIQAACKKVGVKYSLYNYYVNVKAKKKPTYLKKVIQRVVKNSPEVSREVKLLFAVREVLDNQKFSCLSDTAKAAVIQTLFVE